MATSFADVAHQFLNFSEQTESENLVLRLIETAWVQRLRDIAQTGNTKLVYMFSEHSRFGHCLGAAWLANVLLLRLEQQHGDEVSRYRNAVSAAALLHDIGHIAPGSHAAYKVWFPDATDCHEEVGMRIVSESPTIRSILNDVQADLVEQVCAVLAEDPSLPPWAWEIVSGGGWNVDRGNWCIVDSVMAGVSYGRYNVPALLESIVITSDGHLAVKENRLDAMTHFAVARHSMYRQVYQHRVMLASDVLSRAIVDRVRDLLHEGKSVSFLDQAAKAVLSVNSPLQLPLDVLFRMRESWWSYHLMQWSHDRDPILADLAGRLLTRRLFKTVRVRSSDNDAELWESAQHAVEQSGLNPKYYLHRVSSVDMHAGDTKSFMPVCMDDGTVAPIGEKEPLVESMLRESGGLTRSWLVLPAEAKRNLGRQR